jgi:hypothetical protein
MKLITAQVKSQPRPAPMKPQPDRWALPFPAKPYPLLWNPIIGDKLYREND